MRRRRAGERAARRIYLERKRRTRADEKKKRERNKTEQKKTKNEQSGIDASLTRTQIGRS